MNSENTSFNIRNSPWLAYAAMACCIPAAALFMFFFLSIPLAALAIIFALISRGNDSLRGQARLAVITASVTIAVSSWYCHTQIQTFVTRTLPDVARADPVFVRQFLVGRFPLHILDPDLPPFRRRQWFLPRYFPPHVWLFT